AVSLRITMVSGLNSVTVPIVLVEVVVVVTASSAPTNEQAIARPAMVLRIFRVDVFMCFSKRRAGLMSWSAIKDRMCLGARMQTSSDCEKVISVDRSARIHISRLPLRCERQRSLGHRVGALAQ